MKVPQEYSQPHPQSAAADATPPLLATRSASHPLAAAVAATAFSPMLVLAAITLAGLASGCTNLFQYSATISTPLPSASPKPSPSPDVFDLTNVTMATNPAAAAAAAAANTPPTLQLFFDATLTTVPLTNHCSVGGNKTCVCQFSWSQAQSGSQISSSPNFSTLATSSITRTAQTPLLTLTTYTATCNAPDVFTTEISAGTPVFVKLVALTGNPDATLFTLLPSGGFPYIANPQASAATLETQAGAALINILHYTCNENNPGKSKITSLSNTIVNPNPAPNSAGGASATYLSGVQFCTDATNGCNSPTQSYSNQANYYNLYVQPTVLGELSQFNSNLSCYYVQETLGSPQQAFWPLDSTFMLGTQYSLTFNVGVDSHSALNTGGALSPALSATCAQQQAAVAGQAAAAAPAAPAAGGNNAGLVTSCLGYALSPNSAGLCPSFASSSGATIPTYRLRRFVALFPNTFTNVGKPPATGVSQGLDTIYVLDRPVIAPNPSPSQQPFTMLGPKPCPLAYFDSFNVTGSTPTSPPAFNQFPQFPQYRGTSNPAWSGKNYDAIEFPNYDEGLANQSSCSATLPVFNATQSALSFVTVNKNNPRLPHVYIRPVQPFVPHYEEDTGFLACAPQASPLVDPPLHFSKDTSLTAAATPNVAWCAESYPSQNPYIQQLDPAPNPQATNTTAPNYAVTPSGWTANYTSHVAKGTTQNSCKATALSSGSLNVGGSYVYANATRNGAPSFAQHPASTLLPWETLSAANASQTCDRTVAPQYSNAGVPANPTLSALFPLLAPAIDLEPAIAVDSSYFCTITYDGGLGKSNLFVPSSGCCSATQVFVNPTSSTSSAHLEPSGIGGTPNCSAPTY